VTQSNTLASEVRALMNKIAPEKREQAIARLKDDRTRYFKELNDWSRRRGMKATQEVTNRKYWIEQADKRIKALESGEGIRKPEDDTRMTELRRQIEELRIPINRARAAITNARKMDPSGSQYHKSAMLLGEYWSRPVEMFARAFESYVQDKLDKAQRSSTYLTGGTKTTTKYKTHKALSDGSHAQPYPQGEERDAIFKAMDEFISVLRKSGDLQKSLQRICLPLPKFEIRVALDE